MTSKTNNEEYHCDREEPLDREEPSAEPINLNNEEPDCCEPFTWALHRFQLRDLQSPQAMARKYMEREIRMLRRHRGMGCVPDLGCVPDYLVVPDPDDIMSYGFPDDPDEQLDYATCTSEEADGLMDIFDRVVQGGYHGSFAAFARANRPFVRETFPDATPRAVSDALVFAYTTMPYQETREEKARRLIDEAAAAAFSITDLPDAETLPRPLRYASLYNNEEERKTDDIAEAIETCIRLAKGDLKTNDIVEATCHRLATGQTDDIAEAIETCHRLATGKTRLDLVGVYNAAKYRRTEALRYTSARGRNPPPLSLAWREDYAQFAWIIDEYGAHKFLYTCPVPWREVRELLPRMVLANAFENTDPGVWSRPIVR